MIDSLGGIASHPLLVHIPVVLVPLATLGALVLAVRPGLMRAYGPLVVAIAGVAFVGSLLAASSGESLEETYEASGQSLTATLEDHVEMGEQVRLFVGLFFLLALGWLLAARWVRTVGDERAVAAVKRPRLIGIVLALLVAVSGVVATVSVVSTGHSGARSVWEQDV